MSVAGGHSNNPGLGPGQRREGRARRRQLKIAKIVFNNSNSVVDCGLRDMSETGARLRCADQVAVPGEFRLVLSAERVERVCRVVWRRGDEIGVEFAGGAKPYPPRKGRG